MPVEKHGARVGAGRMQRGNVVGQVVDIQKAVELPHHANLNGATQLEEGTRLAALAEELKRLGHNVETGPMTSGLHGIQVVRRGDKTQLLGGADPRREGVALGD